MPSPTILVSGATGMIGTLLMRELAQKDVPFRAMVRPGDTGERLAGIAGAERVEGDFDEAASLEKAMAGIERAFLLTNSSPRAEAQQKAFVEAAKRAGVRHVVKLSQFAAHAASPVRFLRYHAAVEQALRESDLAWTFVRPNLVLQAYLPFAPMIKKGRLQAPIGPEARISVVDARDIAAVAVAALTEADHEGQIYTVTGPQAVTHGEIAAAFGNAGGHDVRFESVPPEAFAAALTGMGMDPWQASGLVEDYAHYDRGEAAEVSPDVERVTGRPPRSVDAFARENAAAFRT